MKQDLLAIDPKCAATKLEAALPISADVVSEELIHELRQPLSVIDTLAYYLEVTASESKTANHARQIQAMVQKVNRILLSARGRTTLKPVRDPVLPRSTAS